MKIWARTLTDRSGAGAAEFAMVLPLLLLLMFGVIDAGRFLWEYNRAEKATQVGARVAAVTDMVPDGLGDYSFSIEDGIAQGAVVPSDNFDRVTCDDTSCDDCTGTVCGEISYDATAFGNIVARMSAMYPQVDASKVLIEYRNIGLGYAGDPNGPDVAPLITVALRDIEFTPITTMLFGGSFNMPDFRASLTAEDSSGTFSN